MSPWSTWIWKHTFLTSNVTQILTLSHCGFPFWLVTLHSNWRFFQQNVTHFSLTSNLTFWATAPHFSRPSNLTFLTPNTTSICAQEIRTGTQWSLALAEKVSVIEALSSAQGWWRIILYKCSYLTAHGSIWVWLCIYAVFFSVQL